MSLQMLVEKLHVLFAEDKVNVEEVQQTMESYQSNYQEWKKYANFDPHRYKQSLFFEIRTIFLEKKNAPT